jgi:hypothetical protein
MNRNQKQINQSINQSIKTSATSDRLHDERALAVGCHRERKREEAKRGKYSTHPSKNECTTGT